MKRLLPLLVLLASGLVARPAAAQMYRFSVPLVEMDNVVNTDGSLTVRYTIRFENTRGAHAIDVVDVGLPRTGYALSRMSAQIDGHNLSDIRPSEYVKVGVEVHLGRWAIPAGGTGTLRFQAVVPDMVYSDTTSDALASLRVTPTWFGEQYVVGTTDLKVAVHLPEGVDPDRVLHQGVPFATKALFRGHPVVAWEWPRTRLTGPHMVGVSFPRSVMSHIVEITKYDLLMMWWKGARRVRFVSAALLLLLFSFVFFRATGGTGFALWVIVGAGAALLFLVAPEVHFWLQLPWIAGLVLLERAVRKRRTKYLPPIVTTEGGGIKRGLTAPEAAVLLELPRGQVLTLVVFGLLKKRIIYQRVAEPLAVEVYAKFRAADPAERRKAAAEAGVVIHAWENAFIDAVGLNPHKDVNDIDFTDAFRGLLEGTVARMSGFDVEQTRAYYRHVISRAWDEAKAIGEVEARTRTVDRNLEWMLMSPDWSTGFGSWHHHGWYYVPLWMRHGPTQPTVPSVGGAGTGSGSGPGFSPSFSDVSGSFAGWTQNVSGSLASTLLPGAAGVAGGKGLVDLSGFDHATGDFFQALASSGGRGGGGSGCACAGCACACACAGGGR